MLVQQKNTDHYSIIKADVSKIDKFYKILRNIIDDYKLLAYKNRAQILFSPAFPSFSNIVEKINNIDPVFVHVTLIWEVWSLHDDWAFTGGCHVKWECEQYLDKCGKCPILNSSKENDLSRKVFIRKYKVFSKLPDIKIIGLSSWIANCAKESTLLKNHEILNLPNVLDTDLYKPTEKHIARELLKLPMNKKTHYVLVLISATNDINKSVVLSPKFQYTSGIDHIYQDPHVDHQRLVLHYGDLSDSSNLTRIINEVQPDEIYNLAAQSHVAVSFESPEYTADVDALGTLRLLEAVRFLGLEKKTKFYQASTSELFGLVQESPQSETTPFYPRSPYAVAKLYAYWITINYREAYGMFACNGILFNHESPRRGETFVTRKITRSFANMAMGLEQCLYLGNMDALRDWGHAKDYVQMQWMMLQQEYPQDYVIATGEQYSVRQFVKWSAEELGIQLRFEGEGVNEIGIIESLCPEKSPALKSGQVIIRVDPRYFRPSEVETLLGDATKAEKELGWKAKISVKQLCAEMVQHDLKFAQKNAFIKNSIIGMVGSAIVRQLEQGADCEILTVSKQELDLCDQSAVNVFFRQNQIDQIYLAAAKVGGIGANSQYPADFIYRNLMIQNNVIHAAHLNDVQKLLFLGSSCIYPKFALQPIAENELMTGYLEPTNEPYAIAKIAGIKMCESYNRQYGRDYRSG
ncbi:hypothetical protein FQR65_LT18159 [Abscondita terminalis]|nr:hypothetical protein FQR65_LT18159 [Abscondita terminalis]